MTYLRYRQRPGVEWVHVPW